MTGCRYGFGFIEYEDGGDAACAIESLNGLQIRPNVVAFVLYDLHVNAEAAIRTLTGTTLPGAGEPLVIRYAQPHFNKQQPPRARRAPSQHIGLPHISASARQPNTWNRQKPPTDSQPYEAAMQGVTSDTGGHVLFVYNLAVNTNESSLRRFFANYGNVINVSIIRDAATGLSTGYGFIAMATYQHCLSAMEALNGRRYLNDPSEALPKNRSFSTSVKLFQQEL
ncbi:ELAV-like protein 2 [Haemaphysalis longicornis]